MRIPVVARVIDYDPTRGTGVVRTEDGSDLLFHGARITDGSRTIDPGAPAVVVVGPGALPGTWEATSVVKTG
jgi:cold shock CspA family protein